MNKRSPSPGSTGKNSPLSFLSLQSIQRVLDGIALDLSGDLLSEDLRQCLHFLAEITGGSITSNEVLGNIFKHFCIGK